LEIKCGIVDFLNLIFGKGVETSEFWANILLPYSSAYFSYPFEELIKHDPNLNALFFSFCTLFGMSFGKHNFPEEGRNKKQNAQKKDGFSYRPSAMGSMLLNPDKKLQLPIRDDDFFKEFGKVESPFGNPEQSAKYVELKGKNRTYQLRNVTYSQLANQFKEFKNEGSIEKALKCCRMRRIMKKLLTDQEDIGIVAELSDLALE